MVLNVILVARNAFLCGAIILIVSLVTSAAGNFLADKAEVEVKQMVQEYKEAQEIAIPPALKAK